MMDLEELMKYDDMAEESGEDDMLLYYTLKKRKAKKVGRRQRRWWVRPSNQHCDRRGQYFQLLSDIQFMEDPTDFQRFCRMSRTSMDKLLCFIGPLIQKEPNARKTLSASERLIITVRYLATGQNFQEIMYGFNRGRSTVGCVVEEVCRAIWNALRGEVLRRPSTQQHWRNIEQEFRERWNFPLCVGAVDGKHVVVKAFRNSGSLYYNYKGTFSLVLLAACDASYKFTFVDIGGFGHGHDAGIFATSKLGKRFNEGTLNLPPNELLPGTSTLAPYCMLGDDAFPLKEDMQKPYPSSGLSREQREYNYRLSRARRVIENTFGIMSQTWQVMLKGFVCEEQRAQAAIRAVVVLHNYVRIENGTGTLSASDKQNMKDWLASAKNSDRESCFDVRATEMIGRNRNPARKALANRDLFSTYFNHFPIPSQQNKYL